MQAETHTIRLIIADQEENLSWGDDINKEAVSEVLTYIKDQLRKKYGVDTFAYRDIENVHYDLDKIIEFKISPIYVSVPHRTDIKTFSKDDPRTVNNSYSFKDPETVKIAKFENSKKFEEVTMKISVIKTLNNTNKNRNFEVEAKEDLAKAQARQASLVNRAMNYINPFKFVKKAEETADYKLPTFGQKDEDLIGSDLLDDDLTKRQKVHGGDGMTQWEFIKMSSSAANQAQTQVPQGGYQAYTLVDVKLHNKRDDAWMVINDKVYDVTNYIAFHPGGNKILAGVGRDGTELFNKYHPWVNAAHLIGKNQVGFLRNEDNVKGIAYFLSQKDFCMALISWDESIERSSEKRVMHFDHRDFGALLFE